MKHKVPVALVGFGSQGRRIAQAVACQPDMKVIGIALNQPDLSAQLAFKIGHPVYCMEPDSTHAFKKLGIPTKESMESLISRAKIVVDCAPPGIGKQNKERFYQKSDIKTIFQAGEEPSMADMPSFFLVTDLEKTRNAKFVRMASPLAVSMARKSVPLKQQFGLEKIFCTFIRAGSETMRANQGPVDTIIPDPAKNYERINWELSQILKEARPSLSSVKVLSILLDVQVIFAELTRKVSAETIEKLLTKTPRTVLASINSNLFSTDSLFEFFRRIRPLSADIYEVCVWKEQIEVQDKTLKLIQAVDPHSVHIPEVVDAIRALATQTPKDENMNLTDKALNIQKGDV